MSAIKKQLEIDMLKDMSYEEINEFLNEQYEVIKGLESNIDGLKTNNNMLTDIINAKNIISDEDVAELVLFINDELPHSGEWWSDGYENFETLGKDMLARGFTVNDIKSAFESVFTAVSCEFGD